jgi:hypothetical protein
MKFNYWYRTIHGIHHHHHHRHHDHHHHHRLYHSMSGLRFSVPLICTQSVGLLDGWLDLRMAATTHTATQNKHTNIHASNGIRTHDISVRVGEDNSRLWLLGHRELLIISFWSLFNQQTAFSNSQVYRKCYDFTNVQFNVNPQSMFFT